MSKQKQIQECESKILIDELSKMPPIVIATAYLHAINYTRYGEDVTEKWVTATQNASALEKSYKKGYHDAQAKVGRWIISEVRCPDCLEYFNTDSYSFEELNICPICGAKMKVE